MVGKEACVQKMAELSGEVLEKHRPALERQWHQLNNAAATDSWEWLAVQAAYTLALVDTIADCSAGTRRPLGDLTRAIQNVIVLAASLCLSDEEFALLENQGLGSPLKQLLGGLLHQGYRDPTADEIEILLSRLGVAKYHIFNEGKKFSRRKKRVKNPKSADTPAAEPLAR